MVLSGDQSSQIITVKVEKGINFLFFFPAVLQMLKRVRHLDQFFPNNFIRHCFASCCNEVVIPIVDKTTLLT